MDLVDAASAVPEDVAAAMQRGLDSVSQPSARVVVAENFARTVSELEQISYEAERGDFGLVAAKVVAAPSNAPHIVINWPAFADASLDLVERTLAHEGGHVAIHARGESQNWDSIAASLPAPQNSVRWAALCALEEFRVERQVGAAGYPIAGRAEKESLDDQLFELSYTVLGALTNTGISNFDLADTILKAQFRFSAVLGYLAGAMIGGRTIFEPSMLSSFGRLFWADVVAGTWAQRLRLYRAVPPSGTPWQGATDRDRALDQAVEIELSFLADLGFKLEILTDDWGFWRTASDAVLGRRLQAVLAEDERRQDT